MDQRFTRSEVERMTGATRHQLDYWARLGLLRPRARWGERFFNFSDLVAVETLRRLTAGQVPARRLSRVVQALERQLGRDRRAALVFARLRLRRQDRGARTRTEGAAHRAAERSICPGL